MSTAEKVSLEVLCNYKYRNKEKAGKLLNLTSFLVFIFSARIK